MRTTRVFVYISSIIQDSARIYVCNGGQAMKFFYWDDFVFVRKRKYEKN